MKKDFWLRNKERLLYLFTLPLGLFLVLAIFLSPISVFRLVFGGIFLLFLPGFSLSFIFYKKEELNLPQRCLISFILTIIFLPLIIYLLSLLGMSVNLLNSSLVALGMIIFSLIILLFTKNVKNIKERKA